MKLGVSYYPELIDSAEWERDLEYMQAARLSVIRMLEFAWTAIEPREGCYEWEWLDRFLDLAHSRQFEVILGTPTATPPAWLTTQYPEVFVEYRDGTRSGPGARRDVDVDNEIFRYYSADIATKLGRRYGAHPAVIGWQIDNELFGPEGIDVRPEVHTPASTFRFRQYLKQVHASVSQLNERWGTRFWSAEYSDWGETSTPKHPRSTMGHVLDYQRYFSDSQADFLKLQCSALRSVIAPRQWITHNSTNVFHGGIDHTKYHQITDVAGWDAYPGAAGEFHMESMATLAHDLFRSAKHRPFWVMETSPALSLDGRNNSCTPAYIAQMRAHGADAVLFWHWRKHRSGREHQCESVCDYAGRPYADRVQILQQLAARPELGDPLPAELSARRAAILYCRDCERINLTSDSFWRRRKWYPFQKVVAETYRALGRLGIAVDFVRPGDPLDCYDLIVMPTAQILGRAAAQQICNFVTNGGTLLGVAKTAHMDEWGKYYQTLGEPLADVLGFTVRQDQSFIEPLQVRLENGKTIPCAPHAERVDLTSARPVAWFTGGPLDGCAAGLVNDCGPGRVFYAAGCAPALIETLARAAAAHAKIPIIPCDVPDGVAVLPHLCDGQGVWIFNHGDKPVCAAGRTVAPHDFALLSDIADASRLYEIAMETGR